MAARKEPTGWVQGIACPQSLFLRRKVASTIALLIPDGTIAPLGPPGPKE